MGMADGLFRCGSWLVSVDMPAAELLRKCGEPTSRETSTQPFYNSHGVAVGTTTTEVWRYDRGSTAAAMVVTVVEGRIQSIQ
jgi:hypothetical protein